MLAGQNESKTKNKSSKELDALLSLNISHLHDAANFFALLKHQIDSGEDLEQLRKFSKGAAYHFRGLFEELQANHAMLNSSEESNLNKFYSKEVVDLKDLLELELLGLCDKRRLRFKDNSKNTRALTEANFGLLVKLLLNIIENAIKHSRANIEIELNESLNHYQVKINSYGASIPENIAADLSNSKGHGLSSAASIIAFHAAKIEILSLDKEGSCVAISFKKHNELSKAATKVYKAKKQSKTAFVIVCATAIFLSFICLNGFTEENNIKKIAITRSISNRDFNGTLKLIQEACLRDENYQQQKTQILRTIKKQYRDYANYAILSSLPKNPDWNKEAEQLVTKLKIPDLYLGLSDIAYKQGHYLEAFKAKLLALYYYFGSSDKEYRICKYLLREKGLDYYLSSIASKTKLPTQIRASKIKQSKNKHETIVNDQKTISQENQFDELNKLIEEENDKLGLNLEL